MQSKPHTLEFPAPEEFPEAQLATTVDTTPALSGVLTNSGTGRIQAANLYRRYASGTRSSTRFQGNDVTDIKRTIWQIGRRDGRVRPTLRRALDENVQMIATVDTGHFVQEDLIGLCRRFGANTPSFAKMDLAGIGAHLMRSLGWYVQTGAITCAQIRGGRAVRLRCLATTDVPMSVASASIFVPRCVDEFVPGTFAVLTACANAYDCTVWTDVLEVNAANQPVIVEPTDNICALAIYSAARILVSLYDAMGCGGVMAYAMVKGAHDVASVVGHSDEGSYLRDVIRAGDFARPFGAISHSFAVGWIGLPAPTMTAESTFVSLFDSILLMSAGAAAISDPTVTIEGRSYPSIYADMTEDMVEPGAAVVGDAANSVVLTAEIALTCGGFVSLYCDQIARIFHTTHAGVAKNVLRAQFNLLAGTDNRHMRYTQVAPWYWVEPTGLFTTVWSTPANLAGLGVFVGTMSEAKMCMFEKHSIAQEHTSVYAAAVSWRSYRTNPLMVVLASHVNNGLGNVVPIQFSADKALLKGGVGTFAAARTAGVDIVGYGWAPNQTTFPHPASFVYLGESIGLKIETAVFTPQLTFVVNNVPNVRDLTGEISSIAGRPARIGNDGLNIVDRTTRRSRSMAANALSNARTLRASGMATGGEIFGVGDFEPMTWHTRDIVMGTGDMIRDVRHLGPSGGINTLGPPMPHFISATPDRFRIAHVARMHGGGGGGGVVGAGGAVGGVGQVGGAGDQAGAGGVDNAVIEPDGNEDVAGLLAANVPAPGGV